ncbi:ABC transporter ATP-binding protein [Proteiniborus sp. MB09-C3]|uniref:ABC transporter ATP-binding protein n=1 Tax=Proteiniborus sp. MB09-C3 TaxID=3050072 RepID=UPI002553BC02|nr:ABC transporter ATP-binding protein [Proteiniborus sp. MB09-C3]WIV11760.1 ABC transporter ATP-binding protein [Proteiniborus sp. MB09-C3]
MESKSSFKKFIRLLKAFPKKLYFILGIVFLTILSVTSILGSYIIKEFLDAATNKNMAHFKETIFLGLIIFGLDTILIYAKNRLLGIYTESGVSRLRKLIAEKIVLMPVKELEGRHSGDYVSIATNDIGKIKTFLSTTVSQMVMIPLSAIGALIYLCILNWKLTLISLILTPILLLGAGKLSEPIGKISKALQEKLGKVNSIVQDVIGGIEISKAYNLEESLGKKHDEAVNESVESGKRLAKLMSMLESFSQVLGIIPFFTTFIIGGYWAIKGTMTVGSLIAFINLLNYLTNPISSLPRLIGETKSSLSAADRVFEILDADEERIDGSSFEIDKSSEAISFSNVAFSYPNREEKILNGLSFAIKKGESVAIVGPSGGGKSTIIRLLLGYYDSYSGEIKVGEKEIKEWNLDSLRSNSALVSQDTYLFPDTIRTNINYGRLDADYEDVVKAAKSANADEFITELENSYDTVVGQLGNTLSGGQKQRLSIARAMLKEAPILLLDEATSALDTESEALVQEALRESIKNKTSLIIAHRLSTIKNVDRILVLKDGAIVEEGSHDELLTLNGVYTELYNNQLKNQELTLKKEVV